MFATLLPCSFRKQHSNGPVRHEVPHPCPPRGSGGPRSPREDAGLAGTHDQQWEVPGTEMARPGEDDLQGPLDPRQEEGLQPGEGRCPVQGVGHTLRYEGKMEGEV